MPWKKANKEMIAQLENLMRSYDCDRRPMFGSPTFFVNGRMFTGVHEDTIILRLSETDQKEISLQSKEVKPFTPMGRVMKDYVAIPEKAAGQETFLKYWMDRSFAYTRSLPPKIAKRPAGKRPKS
jgi:TfoX/Sxy family transcriptional regulator of competence genes